MEKKQKHFYLLAPNTSANGTICVVNRDVGHTAILKRLGKWKYFTVKYRRLLVQVYLKKY